MKILAAVSATTAAITRAAFGGEVFRDAVKGHMALGILTALIYPGADG